MKSEIIEFINRSKDIPNKLANTLLRILSGFKELNLLEYKEELELKNLYGVFNNTSIEVLGKSVKYKQNVLFHLLRKIGKEPDINKKLYRAFSRQANGLTLNISVLQGLLRVNGKAEKRCVNLTN